MNLDVNFGDAGAVAVSKVVGTPVDVAPNGATVPVEPNTLDVAAAGC